MGVGAGYVGFGGRGGEPLSTVAVVEATLVKDAARHLAPRPGLRFARPVVIVIA